jgi:lysophospholipase L1-like esterase
VRTIDALDPASNIRLASILDAEPTREGARLRRLPPWTRQQLLDPAARFVATMPSGARLDFVTDSTTIEIDALLTRLQFGQQPMWPAVFDLVIDGEVVESKAYEGGRVIWTDPGTLQIEVRRGPAVTIVFDGLPPVPKHVEVWLAQSAAFELRGARVDDRATVEPPPPPKGPRWAHYGSSISHCIEAAQPTHVWPVVAARRAAADLHSFGFGGQCQLDQYVARTLRDLDVDVISLKLGINVINGDTMRERTFLSAVQGFLDTVRDGHPATPIAIVTPIICPVAEDHPGPTVSGPDGVVYVVHRPAELREGVLTLQRIRTLLADVVTARQAAGDAHLHLLDGLRLFGPEDVGDLPDGLHPNDAGYVRMGERFHAMAFGEGGVFSAFGEGVFPGASRSTSGPRR